MSNMTTVSPNNLPAVATGNYVTQILDSLKEGFLAANPDMDFDFVNIGTWLYISKKGNFIEKDSDGKETANYGDRFDVVVARGEKRWTLWGATKSPEEGQLLASNQNKDDAKQELLDFLQTNPEAQTRYDINSLELRYVAWVVPISSLRPDGFPKIFQIPFPKTTTYSWGKYAQDLFLGKFAKEAAVPANTGVNRVVTRMITVERGEGDKAWIGIDFEAVGMFDPQDYGIDWKADANAAAPVASFAQPVVEAKVAAGAEPY